MFPDRSKNWRRDRHGNEYVSGLIPRWPANRTNTITAADRTPFSQLKSMSNVQPAVAEVEAETNYNGSEDKEMVGRNSWYSESDPLVAGRRTGNNFADQVYNDHR